MLVINKDLSNSGKPRVGHFGSFEIVGRGNLEGAISIRVIGDNSSGVKAYVIGDLTFVSSLNADATELGKEITLTNATQQDFYVKATTLKGGFLYLNSQTKIGELGYYDPNTQLFSMAWLGRSNWTDISNIPIIYIDAKNLPANLQTFSITSHLEVYLKGKLSDIPSNIKNIQLQCYKDGLRYTDLDINGALDNGIEALQITTFNRVFSIMRVTKPSDKLKNLGLEYVKLDCDINYITYPNLERLRLVQIQNTTDGQGANVDINGLKNLKSFFIDQQTKANLVSVNLVADLDNLNSDFQELYVAGGATNNNVKLTNVANFPNSLRSFYYRIVGNNSNINYSGKTWVGAINYFQLPNNGLPTSELDQLIIDLDSNSIEWNGNKRIQLKGVRSSASDAAIASLTNKGVTVTIFT